MRSRAADLGFEAFGVAPADSAPQALQRLRNWLESGHHGDMLWMAETPERRADPQGLWPEVRAVIILGLNYGIADDALANLGNPTHGSIALYARRRDYHEIIKGRLKELAGFLVSKAGGDVKVFVDTAPVLEKTLAEAAGLGWQGKNTVLISRDFGTWLFLGAIYTTLELPANVAGVEACGSCTRCLDICPTQAFPAPFMLDSRRCISYLTIEHKGPIPRDLRTPIGNRIFGCDDCLAVCPWNKFARDAHDAKLGLHAHLDGPALADLAALDDAAFRRMFAGTPIKRTGHERFLRNVLIAIGNSGLPQLHHAAMGHLHAPSAIVRGSAVWAISRLLPAAQCAALTSKHLPLEADLDVREEWRLALEG